MDVLFGALKDTPLPTVLVVSGIFFWILAVAGSIAGRVTVDPAIRRLRERSGLYV